MNALCERLAGQGFVEAIDEPVICRWHHRASKLILDVMPTDPEILGFTNAWYASAPASLHRFVSAEAGSLLQHPDVDYAILDATREYGSAQAERGQVVRERLGAIAAIA